MNFEATQEEFHAGSLTPEKLSAVRESISSNGFAVISGLISPESCELLLPAMLEDVKIVRADDKPTDHEKLTGSGHMQLGVRRYAPYVRTDLVANPLIESVVAEVLGHGAWLGFFNGNMNYPGSGFQPLHYDRPYSWKSKEDAEAAGQSWPPPTSTLSCSVALTDITEESGATEIYPGSQNETAVANWTLGERLENHPELIKKWGPPRSMTIPRGGVCFRDPRMWHRGVPNHSDVPRPMLALTYHSKLAKHWRGTLVSDMLPADEQRCRDEPNLRVLDNGELGHAELLFHENTRTAFESSPSFHGINRHARFVKAPHAVNHFMDAHSVGGARVVDDGPIRPQEN